MKYWNFLLQGEIKVSCWNFIYLIALDYFFAFFVSCILLYELFGLLFRVINFNGILSLFLLTLCYQFNLNWRWEAFVLLFYSKLEKEENFLSAHKSLGNLNIKNKFNKLNKKIKHRQYKYNKQISIKNFL